MSRNARKKRPCCICRKWFNPDVRQRKRQVTCGDPACRRERHRRQCREWNRKNKDYFKGNYLNSKNEKIVQAACGSDGRRKARDAPSKSTPDSRLDPLVPRDVVLDWFGPQFSILIDYLSEQIVRRVKAETAKIVSATQTVRPPPGGD
jgi:hypothetical protein